MTEPVFSKATARIGDDIEINADALTYKAPGKGTLHDWSGDNPVIKWGILASVTDMKGRKVQPELNDLQCISVDAMRCFKITSVKVGLLGRHRRWTVHDEPADGNADQ